MPRLGPIKRRELIACLRQLGFMGPYAGGRDQFMFKGQITLTLSNGRHRARPAGAHPSTGRHQSSGMGTNLTDAV